MTRPAAFRACLALLACLTLLVLLPGAAKAESYCFLIRNKAPYMVLGHVENESRDRVVFRLNKGETKKYCLEGKLYKDHMVYMVLKNILTIPIFDCKVTIRGPIDIFGFKQGEGYKTFFPCTEHRGKPVTR